MILRRREKRTLPRFITHLYPSCTLFNSNFFLMHLEQAQLFAEQGMFALAIEPVSLLSFTRPPSPEAEPVDLFFFHSGERLLPQARTPRVQSFAFREEHEAFPHWPNCLDFFFCRSLCLIIGSRYDGSSALETFRSFFSGFLRS